MRQAKDKENTEMGVIIGRFQCDNLHDGHKGLIEYVLDRHERVVIFLGMSNLKCTKNNPLDFEARKQMIDKEFKDRVEVHYVKDQMQDDKWSNFLDEKIKDLLGPMHKATLYGSRDSFISHYQGVFETIELVPDTIVSATDLRKKLSIKAKASTNFRQGVIWATQNRYPTSFTTIDVAIFNEDTTKVLLGKKPNEDLYRFIGGFVEPGDTLERTVKKEAQEETGLEIGDIQYVASFAVEDWRYRSEQDKIMTTLFTAKKVYGAEKPNDDIEQLRWFDIADIKETDLVAVHTPLFRKLFPEKDELQAGFTLE
jgi:bifunctional NMN adenylyltransferase/nudix hydrolase